MSHRHFHKYKKIKKNILHTTALEEWSAHLQSSLFHITLFLFFLKCQLMEINRFFEFFFTTIFKKKKKNIIFPASQKIRFFPHVFFTCCVSIFQFQNNQPIHLLPYATIKWIAARGVANKGKPLFEKLIKTSFLFSLLLFFFV